MPSFGSSVWNDAVVGPIFDDHATMSDLIKLVLVLAAIVFVAFELLMKPVFSWIARGPLHTTMRTVARMEFRRGVDAATEDEHYEEVMTCWPLEMCIGIHHALGGALAGPAVFGMKRYAPSVRSSLACLGILTEMGFEIQDLCGIAYKCAFGKQTPDTGFVVFCVIHHSLTCVLGLPMILQYRELPYLHRLCFNLQFAGGASIIGSQITRALDVSKKKELMQFLLVSILMLGIMLWTRLFDWFYSTYKILAQLYADENWTFLVVATPLLLAFSVFNVLVCVIPSWKRCIKFLAKLKSFRSLPNEADEATRQSSVHDLQLAAAEWSSVETDPIEILTGLFEDERAVQRRHTFHSTELSRSATHAAAAAASSNRRLLVHRQTSMQMAWRDMPSRVPKRAAETKSD